MGILMASELIQFCERHPAKITHVRLKLAFMDQQVFFQISGAREAFLTDVADIVLLSRVFQFVTFEVIGVEKGATTDITNVIFFPCVHFTVLFHLGLQVEHLPTKITSKRLFPVELLMLLQHGFLAKAFATQVAHMVSLSRVDQHVARQVAHPVETLTTDTANMILLPRVGPQMNSQGGGVGKPLVAVLTLVGFLLEVEFPVLPQIVLRGVRLVADVARIILTSRVRVHVLLQATG
jgi:hypothetical protein